MNEPRVRVAPSPTGNLHIGTARTALFNFLFAKKNSGRFILRIEDTDKERSKSEFEENIRNGLNWLGIIEDEFYKQSDRSEIYKRYLKKLLDSGSAYVSKEKPKEEGDREEVIRFKNPNTSISFDDIVRGVVKFDTTELGDFVIAKSLEEPLYHLAVVVDDHEMGISHIIRGEDHISNTPRQLLIQVAIGAKHPLYAHIPLILAKDRSRLSKRHGAVSVEEYKKIGYLPEAVINYIALLGWNPGTEQEIFSLEELIGAFDLNKVQKGGAVFDEEKLKWINGEHKKRLIDSGKIDPDTDTFEAINTLKNEIGSKINKDDEDKIMRLLKVSGANKSTVTEQVVFIKESGFMDYVPKQAGYEKEKLLWKKEKDFDNIKRHINKMKEILYELPEEKFTSDDIKDAVWDYASKEGTGSVLWPFRVALSGRDKSPDPFSLAEILGKEETIKRLIFADNKLKK